MLHEHRLYTIREDRWSGEYIAIDTDTNIPHMIYWDGGNMWGNREIAITWAEVETYDFPRFVGINEHNWQSYIREE